MGRYESLEELIAKVHELERRVESLEEFRAIMEEEG